MKVSWRDGHHPCRNCGREYPANRLDRRMWCPDCRKVVIRRATWVGQGVGLLTALSLAIWIFIVLGPSPRFLFAYLTMIVAAYFLLYKLTQRVAFEVIQARGVPPPPRSEDEE